MKKHEVEAYIASRIADRTNSAVEANARASDSTNSADERKAQKELESEHKHAVKFLTTLANDDTYAALATARVSADALRAIESDAKSLEKLAFLMRACKSKVKLAMHDDDALAQACAYLSATNYAETSADALRKQIKSKKTKYSEAHTTTRQSAMILNLFERLHVAKRERRDSVNYYAFDSESAILKALEVTYQ